MDKWLDGMFVIDLAIIMVETRARDQEVVKKYNVTATLLTIYNKSQRLPRVLCGRNRKGAKYTRDTTTVNRRTNNHHGILYQLEYSLSVAN
jgi:hypothetical protein